MASSGDHILVSQKPYLLRALHEWCSDNGFTPYITVFVDEQVDVPMQYVQQQEIVLNISWESTHGLRIDNEFIAFSARFGGVARELFIPISHVLNIYARENAQGMAFPFQPQSKTTREGVNATHSPKAPPLPTPSEKPKRPTFTVVK
jgi:stringent starvation protein B